MYNNTIDVLVHAANVCQLPIFTCEDFEQDVDVAPACHTKHEAQDFEQGFGRDRTARIWCQIAVAVEAMTISRQKNDH